MGRILSQSPKIPGTLPLQYGLFTSIARDSVVPTIRTSKENTSLVLTVYFEGASRVNAMVALPSPNNLSRSIAIFVPSTEITGTLSSKMGAWMTITVVEN